MLKCVIVIVRKRIQFVKIHCILVLICFLRQQHDKDNRRSEMNVKYLQCDSARTFVTSNRPRSAIRDVLLFLEIAKQLETRNELTRFPEFTYHGSKTIDISCRFWSANVKSSQVKSSQVKSSQVKSSQVKSSQVKSSQVKSSQVKSSQVKSSQVKSTDGKHFNSVVNEGTQKSLY